MQTIVQTPTADLKESLDFYEKLNFKVLSSECPTLVTDGNVVIEINPDRSARAGVKLFSENWKPIVEELEKVTTVVKTENGYLLSDTCGTWIYLLETDEVITAKNDPTSFSKLGNFSGLSVEAIAFETAAKIWGILGFKYQKGAVEQGWLSLINDSGMIISLMKPLICPHMFFSPSLTYFNGDKNLGIIAEIRAANFPITEEINCFNEAGIVDNIIIRDPGGLGCFVFSD